MYLDVTQHTGNYGKKGSDFSINKVLKEINAYVISYQPTCTKQINLQLKDYTLYISICSGSFINCKIKSTTLPRNPYKNPSLLKVCIAWQSLKPFICFGVGARGMNDWVEITKLVCKNYPHKDFDI